MILIQKNINDNSIVMMWGLVKKIILILCIALFTTNSVSALEKVGIITDTLFTQVNYYNAYYRTPEFFAQDVRHELIKRNMQVIAPDIISSAIKTSLTAKDINSLQGLQQGYNLNYEALKKISKKIGAKKLIIITMGIDIQRDFLKNTLWNVLNVPGFDTVNPTHRVSVYAALIDTPTESVLWESVYAKNIRNNKIKNLDTTISNNYEGMLRLKEYSKYISPDIAYNVKMKMLNENYIEPPTYITRDNIKQYVKDKHNLGVKKELSEITREKYDTKKLMNDSADNIAKVGIATKNGIVKTSKATTNGAKKLAKKSTKSKSKTKTTKKKYTKNSKKKYNKTNTVKKKTGGTKWQSL